jgi:hypothetical protein
VLGAAPLNLGVRPTLEDRDKPEWCRSGSNKRTDARGSAKGERGLTTTCNGAAQAILLS